VVATLFSPAYTSIHAIFRSLAVGRCTAASNTRTAARQMSGPVPSPSMKGTIGRLGTWSVPPS
jgi:hypothetical protein